jgi:predicted thioesterase
MNGMNSVPRTISHNGGFPGTGFHGMTTPPRIGTVHELPFQVTAEHTISFDGLPPVLSTPWLIWFVEHAALELVKPHLDENELTVGTRIELDHQSPAVEGEQIQCEARLILIDGNALTFQCRAMCAGRTISRGLHKRAVVNRERLRRRLESLK